MAVRASFTAASTASAPVGPQNWILPPRSDARQDGEERLDERVAQRGGEVERRQRHAAVERGAQRGDDDRVRVPERERAGAREAVEVHPAVGVADLHPLASGEHDRQAA